MDNMSTVPQDKELFFIYCENVQMWSKVYGSVSPSPPSLSLLPPSSLHWKHKHEAFPTQTDLCPERKQQKINAVINAAQHESHNKFNLRRLERTNQEQLKKTMLKAPQQLQIIVTNIH